MISASGLSIKVSLLTIELVGTDMLITSPPSRLLASSNGAGARRALEKAIDDRAAAQGAALVVGQSVQFDIAVGEVEKLVNVVRRQPLDPEQVAVRENGATAAPLCMSRRYRGRRPHAEGRPRPSGRQYCWMIPGDSKIAVNAHPKRIGVAAIDEPRVYQCTCRGGCLALPRSAST